MKKKFGPVNGYFDYYAEAPYFSNPTDWVKPDSTLDDAFVHGERDLDHQMNVDHAQHGRPRGQVEAGGDELRRRG